MRLLGIENAIFEVIATCLEDTDECADQSEIAMIAQYDSFHNGYNGHRGGKIGGSGENNPMFGKTQSQETRDKIAGKLTGRKCSEQFRERRRQIMTGSKQSPETIAKRAAKQTGRKPSAEHIENNKISHRQYEWTIYRTDNRKDITPSLNQWCKDNGYKQSNLSHVYRRKSGHKDIIRVERVEYKMPITS
jgi:hypothetical protein